MSGLLRKMGSLGKGRINAAHQYMATLRALIKVLNIRFCILVKRIFSLKVLPSAHFAYMHIMFTTLVKINFPMFIITSVETQISLKCSFFLWNVSRFVCFFFLILDILYKWVLKFSFSLKHVQRCFTSSNICEISSNFIFRSEKRCTQIP